VATEGEGKQAQSHSRAAEAYWVSLHVTTHTPVDSCGPLQDAYMRSCSLVRRVQALSGLGRQHDGRVRRQGVCGLHAWRSRRVKVRRRREIGVHDACPGRSRLRLRRQRHRDRIVVGVEGDVQVAAALPPVMSDRTDCLSERCSAALESWYAVRRCHPCGLMQLLQRCQKVQHRTNSPSKHKADRLARLRSQRALSPGKLSQRSSIVSQQSSHAYCLPLRPWVQ